YIFFFQAEDGIRAFHVTGVQTCALPICRATRQWSDSLKRSAMKEFIFLYSALEWVTTRTLRWRRLRTGVTVITPTLIISRKQRKYWSTSSAERCSLLRRTSNFRSNSIRRK